MTASGLLSDVDAVAARARALWREARERHRGRLDVYVKTSIRIRVARPVGPGADQVSHARECGIAVRLVEPGGAQASFAASSGATAEDVRWAVSAAASSTPGHDPAMPAPGSVHQPERRDFDPIEPLPDSEELMAWLSSHATAEWVECGLTVEALAGDEGWLTLRRRNRVWALLDDGRPRLVARRGYRIDDGADVRSGETAGPSEIAPSPAIRLLRPAAAASLIAAVAKGVHGDPSLVGSAVAQDWRITDDPTDEAALFGGCFDDAGFEASHRVLADGGRMISSLAGPGTLRRMSYRDAPCPGHSHLIFQGRKAGLALSTSRPPVSRCRVVPLDREAWLLQLDSDRGGDAPEFVAIAPASVPRIHAGIWGAPILAAEGVLTPGLTLEIGTG